MSLLPKCICHRGSHCDPSYEGCLNRRADSSPAPIEQEKKKSQDEYFFCQSDYDGGKKCLTVCTDCMRERALTVDTAGLRKAATDAIWKAIMHFQDARLEDDACDDRDTWSDKVLSYNEVESELYDVLEQIDPSAKEPPAVAIEQEKKEGYPDHVHVRLPSGAIANVSPDASPELLDALDQMCEAARNMPEPSAPTSTAREEGEVPEHIMIWMDETVDKYAFQVPYDGSNQFYDEKTLKDWKAGAIAMYHKMLKMATDANARYSDTILDLRRAQTENTALQSKIGALEREREELKAIVAEKQSWINSHL